MLCRYCKNLFKVLLPGMSSLSRFSPIFLRGLPLFIWMGVIFFIYSRETFEKILLLAAVFSITYGVSDEFHQFFVPYRGAKMSDVLIDGLGALLIGASLWLIMNIRYRKR